MVSSAGVHGRVMVRPWRLGILADVQSPNAVRQAITGLSSVWGGMYMPILDRNASRDEIERLAHLYDVDALYGEDLPDGLKTLVNGRDWRWSAIAGEGGRKGPFGEFDNFRTGLLPIWALPNWTPATAMAHTGPARHDDLAGAAIWGIPDETHPIGGQISPIEATSYRIHSRNKRYLNTHAGIFIVDGSRPEEVVRFWNARMYGANVLPLLPNTRLATLPPGFEPSLPTWTNETQGETRKVINAWGLDAAHPELANDLAAHACDHGVELINRSPSDWPTTPYQGLDTPFRRTFRTDFQPAALWAEVPLPDLPLREDPKQIRWGTVAADIEVEGATGQDPRFTVEIPPYRHLSKLLEYAVAQSSAAQGRVTATGQTIAIEAESDTAPLAFAYNLEVFRLLFNDESVTTDQSEVGRFQARAAEKLGGPFAGTLSQPSARAVLTLAASDRDGVTLPHLIEAAKNKQGEWPATSRGNAKQYPRQVINRLLDAGLFVPTHRVHCSHCRVERWVSADDIQARMRCEFCAQEFELALSHSLAPPAWRYRLAAHLRSDQIQALLPALATTSLLQQFRHVQEPPMAHVLGLNVRDASGSVEVDVAAYIREFDWLTVVGEVKSANRIDGNDVENLERLETRLRNAKVRAMSLFATLKTSFSESEVLVLRERVTRSVMATAARGGEYPTVPLVLTGPDLSHDPFSRDHPWRWKDPAYSGLLATAVESCRRNLGLLDFEWREDGTLHCEWSVPA